MDYAALHGLGALLAIVLLWGAACRAHLPPVAPEEKPMQDENPTPPSPTRVFPDFNNNGTPDYKEGWFWRGAWRAFSWGVRAFAKPHTLIYKGVEAAERARAELEVPRVPVAP